MTASPIRDLAVGLFLVAGLAAVAYLSLPIGGLRLPNERVTLYAAFDEVGQLRERAQVVIGGVRVGEVVDVSLDPDLRARVTFHVDSRVELPEDTSASILTAGILGDQYIALEPGGSDMMLESGAEIAFTQSAFIIERAIGRVVQNLGEGG